MCKETNGSWQRICGTEWILNNDLIFPPVFKGSREAFANTHETKDGALLQPPCAAAACLPLISCQGQNSRWKSPWQQAQQEQGWSGSLPIWALLHVVSWTGVMLPRTSSPWRPNVLELIVTCCRIRFRFKYCLVLLVQRYMLLNSPSDLASQPWFVFGALQAYLKDLLHWLTSELTSDAPYLDPVTDLLPFTPAAEGGFIRCWK